MNTRPKLLFVVTEDWYFVSHRLPLAVSVTPPQRGNCSTVRGGMNTDVY
jgi:hypothetical protein